MDTTLMTLAGATPVVAVASTQASSVYDRLREGLLTGRLTPSRKLQMRFLMETYQTGQTPLREALNRERAENEALFNRQQAELVELHEV